MASESECHDGMHIWTDQYHVEVVDAETKQPVPEGEMGLLVVTPFWNNTDDPVPPLGDRRLCPLRGSRRDRRAVRRVFPMIRHAARTAGFFKVRGININQAEIEDFLYRRPGDHRFQDRGARDRLPRCVAVSPSEAAGSAGAECRSATVAALTRSVTGDLRAHAGGRGHRTGNARTRVRGRGEAEPVHRPARNAGLRVRGDQSSSRR